MKQHKASPVSQLLAEVPGIGPIGALSLALTTDPGRFTSGRHFAAWLLALLERKPRKLAAVALANKVARVAWAMMATGEAYRGSKQSPCRRPRLPWSPDPLAKSSSRPLHPRGRSPIAPPPSTASCLLMLLPYQGHGLLRSRRLPLQNPVRSTGAAMSTTASHATHAAQGPFSQPACTIALAGNPHIHAAVWPPG